MMRGMAAFTSRSYPWTEGYGGEERGDHATGAALVAVADDEVEEEEEEEEDDDARPDASQLARTGAAAVLDGPERGRFLPAAVEAGGAGWPAPAPAGAALVSIRSTRKCSPLNVVAHAHTGASL
jgi:hypothetical protein